jgi:hypothetical protein
MTGHDFGGALPLRRAGDAPVEPSYLGLIIAPLIAVIVSIIELTVRKDRGLYRRAIWLCALYVIFDAAAALILFVILRAGAKLLDSDPTTAAGVTAGLIAPLLMRTNIPLPFLKDKQAVYAVAMLRRLQIRVKGQIDDMCGAEETAWILDTVLPNIEILSLDKVSEWTIQSIKVKYNEPGTRKFRQKYIAEVERAATDQIDENKRKHLIIQILLDRCGRGQVVTLVKRAKKLSADGNTIPAHREIHEGFGKRPDVELAGAPVDPDDDTSHDSGDDTSMSTSDEVP